VEQYDNIYDKIQELLGSIPGNVSILEEQIDADVQLEYYNYSQHLKRRFNPDEVLKKREIIFHQDLAVEDKKHLIVQLASIDSIEAYRTLEQYSNGKNEQLKDWATLALQECRLLLESRLLDQSQILISTGLGGKGLKLRYYAVLISANGMPYTPFQKKIVADEIRFAVRKSRGEVEKVGFNKELCTVLSIIPLQVAVQKLFDDFISECNNYGDFINRDYIITNVKVISNSEVRELIDSSRHKNKTRKS
jgi:hypothetical protein